MVRERNQEVEPDKRQAFLKITKELKFQEITMTNSPPNESKPSGFPIGKIILLVSVLAAFGVCFYYFRDLLSLQALADRESDFRAYQKDNPFVVYGIAFIVYVVVTGLSLPGAAILTLLMGWLFGFLGGLVLVSFASTSGASIAFLLSRYLMRDTIQNKFGKRLKSFNDALAKEGAFYLFSLRLIPLVPFFVINVVMGLTPIKLKTYWWVSQIGMLPGTAAYVYAGYSVPSLQKFADDGLSGIVSPQLLAAFVILGLFPIVVKKGYTIIRKKMGYDSEALPDDIEVVSKQNES